MLLLAIDKIYRQNIDKEMYIIYRLLRLHQATSCRKGRQPACSLHSVCFRNYRGERVSSWGTVLAQWFDSILIQQRAGPLIILSDLTFTHTNTHTTHMPSSPTNTRLHKCTHTHTPHRGRLSVRKVMSPDELWEVAVIFGVKYNMASLGWEVSVLPGCCHTSQDCHFIGYTQDQPCANIPN